ncbi:MAG: Rieske (2Fe-2S) protein [Proteobacteria bacterium]|nr:Rieske (2Fe-2S) protein [Pseudomonadota bacterium]
MKVRKQPTVDRPGKILSRRSFLNTVWIGLGFVALGEFAWIGASFFKPRKSRTDLKSEKFVEVGAVGDFAPGTVTPFRHGGFYLSRLENGGFLALSSRCSHLGCAVTWNPESERFECPCHSSVFDIKGEVVRPPAPRALDYFPVVVENNGVKVYTGEKMKRRRFLQRQVTKV